MNRQQAIERLSDNKQMWDFIVIGGGATGSGVALEAASRGYSVVLLEEHDFAKGTSSRSTKLIHGGVRYLAQGNISLVLEALRERGVLLKNAPHLVHNLAFVVPSYDWWEGPFYGIGLKLYDMLAGKAGFGSSRHLSREETIAKIPNIEQQGLNGGTIYYDGQFDDARLVINILQTASEQGAVVMNYMPVRELVKEHGLVCGVLAEDTESGETYTLRARAVINATGPFSDAVRRMDDAHSPHIIRPSQGVHIVLSKEFLAGESAIMVPHTDDGRILFAIPWYEHTLVGTTETPLAISEAEPKAMDSEIDFLLKHAARYLTRDPQRSDILSVFAGIRPMVAAQDTQNTAAISREHSVLISPSGLVSVAGGKWTTYRVMAEDTIEQALLLANLEPRPSVSVNLNIHGFYEASQQFGALQAYGSDARHIKALMEEDAVSLHDKHEVYAAEILWAAEHEWCRTIEDFLARRRRILFLDARAAMEMAPEVSRILAACLKRDARWQKEQVEQFNRLAANYLP